MLTGHGAYTSSAVQLTYPVEMHQLAQSLALRALLLVPDKKISSPYSTIKQGANEPYGQFIDRLAAALKDATNLTSGVQEHLFCSLAFENASSCTRTILATLPQGSPVDEMLVRATRAEQSNQNAAFMATIHDAIKHQGHIIAAALTNGKSKNKSSHRNKSTNPLQALSNHIIRVGGMRIPSISTDPIRITFEDNQVIVAQPYVMLLPVELPGVLGRDVLSQLGLVLTTDQHFFLMATAEQPPILKITWLTDNPAWVEQWPMTETRLQIAEQLIQEQLNAGHIRPSVSPWNTPIFVIQKKPGKWRLLHDL
ncbi:hypothetical protein HGM15179_020554 [Zosterops borbonicus]|uniref:Retroviral nucleocapsid Gag protein p24 C-terminal domain-containing protein n=1 Tax=Zosterops borbonicus TaxID=364589 RepID=A0A8K1D7J5_9PASS|nr:hypothetical protein HGM15179_020554 [Zosterops borbonicus]